MRQAILLAVMITAFFASAYSQGGTKVDGKFVSGGTERTFIIYLPSGLPANPPLVLGLHCLSGSPTQHEQLSGFDKIADREKFIVVYPQGIDKSAGAVGWDISTNMDENFLVALIDTMAARYKIDRNRVYSTGFSMGGMMSHKLACDVPDKIAAIGTASGYPLYGNNNCSPSRPVPICHTHGTEDKVVAYSGLNAWIAKFVKGNGCPASPTTTNPTSKYKREYWGPCKDGSEIVVYHFDGMQHGYVNTSQYSFSASDTFWTFFAKHPRTTVKIAAPAATEPAMSRFSAKYTAGIVSVKAGLPIRSVRVFDVRGGTVFSGDAGSGLKRDVSFQVLRRSGGIFIVTIQDAAGKQGVAKIIVP